MKTTKTERGHIDAAVVKMKTGARQIYALTHCSNAEDLAEAAYAALSVKEAAQKALTHIRKAQRRQRENEKFQEVYASVVPPEMQGGAK